MIIKKFYLNTLLKMTTQENIQKYLPEHLRNVALEYNIPNDMIENNADLVVLVLESKSISDQKEKQSWFDLYSLMNQDQIDKLRDILTREKQKLAEIEDKYQKKQEEITNKLMLLDIINNNKIKSEMKKKLHVNRKKWKLMLYLIRSKKCNYLNEKVI